MHAICRAYANYLSLSIIGTSTLYVVMNTAGRGEKEQWGPNIADETDKQDESEHCHSSFIYKTNILHYIFSVVHLYKTQKRPKVGSEGMQEVKKRKTRRKTKLLTEKPITKNSATSSKANKKGKKKISDCDMHADKDVPTTGENLELPEGQIQAHGVGVPVTEHATFSPFAHVQVEPGPNEEVTGKRNNSNSLLAGEQSRMLVSGPAEDDDEILKGSLALTSYVTPSDSYGRVHTSIEHTSPWLRSHGTRCSPYVSGSALRTKSSSSRTPAASGSKSSSFSGKEQESMASTTLYFCLRLGCEKCFTTEKHREQHWNLPPDGGGCKILDKITERPFGPKPLPTDWEEDSSEESIPSPIPSPPEKKRKLSKSSTVKNSDGKRPLGTQNLNIQPAVTDLETPSVQSSVNRLSSTKGKGAIVSVVRKRGTPRRSAQQQRVITISP